MGHTNILPRFHVTAPIDTEDKENKKAAVTLFFDYFYMIFIIFYQ